MISVIIPTYNRTRLLVERCLPSVFAQTVQDQEILVVGDGTEQATVDAMADLPVRFWNLPHYEYPANPLDRWGLLGLAALNFGLDQARGEWIAVLADDDEWTPDHHEVLLSASEDVDHVYGISDTYKEGQPTGQLYGAWPPGPGQFCNGANLYRASLGYRYDLGCRSRGRNGDEDLWLRMMADGVRFRFVPQIVHHYHRNYP
jgi:glycosyltransferase involved in cell wall biosynthesis